MTNRIKINVVVFIVLTFVTIFITWPLVLNLNSLIIDRFDGLLITWIYNWIAHTITAGPSGWGNLFQANIFFPYHNTLAFADLFLSGGIISIPVLFLAREPLLAFNVNFLLGFLFSGFSLYLLLEKLSGNRKISLSLSIL